MFDSSHLYATQDMYTLRLAKASIKETQHTEEYKKIKKAFRELSSPGVRRIECDEKLPESIVKSINNLEIDYNKPIAFILRDKVKTLSYSRKDEKFYAKSVDDSGIQPFIDDQRSFLSTYFSLVSTTHDMTIPSFSDSTNVKGFPCCVRCSFNNGSFRMSLLRIRITPHNFLSIQGSLIQQYVVQNLSCHINLEEKKVVFIKEEKDLYISCNNLIHVYVYTIDYANFSESMKKQYKDEVSTLIQQVVTTRKATQIFLKIGLFLRCAMRMETIFLSMDYPQVEFILKISAFSSGMAIMKKNNRYLQVPKVRYDPTSFITQEMRIELIAGAYKDGFSSKIIGSTYGYILALCRKRERENSFFITALHIQFSSFEKQIVLSLLDVLTSVKNTFFENLYYDVLKKGKTSIVIQYKESLYTFAIAIISETHFHVSCCPFEITLDHLLCAKVSFPFDVMTAINPLLLGLYTNAISSASKKESGVYIRIERGSLYIQLHVKKDSAITLGIETYFNDDVFNEVEKIIKITIPLIEIPFSDIEKRRSALKHGNLYVTPI